MNKLRTLVLVGIACLFAACSSVPNAKTNYVPPSTGKVAMHVTSAQERVARASKRADKITSNLGLATAQANTVSEKLVKLAELTTDQPTLNSLAVSIKGDVDNLTKILLETQTENQGLTTDLAQTAESLRQAQIARDELQMQVDTQTIQLNDANAHLNTALAQSAVDRHNAHVFKGIIIGIAVIAVAAVIFGIFGVAAFAPPLVYLMGGAPLLTGVFLYFWLG